jgi:hypothetical protein
MKGGQGARHYQDQCTGLYPHPCGTGNPNTTVQAEIYLQVYGINGELSQVYYTFQ